jgi:hypothetical protein
MKTALQFFLAKIIAVLMFHRVHAFAFSDASGKALNKRYRSCMN